MKVAGKSGGCPAKKFKAKGTSCRVSSGPWDQAETCDGALPFCPTDKKLAKGTVCRMTSGPCDASEMCDGASAACPVDGNKADGTSCAAVMGARRGERAGARVRDAALDGAGVGCRSGYTAAANFGRACRRWFGMPPRRYRNEVLKRR